MRFLTVGRRTLVVAVLIAGVATTAIPTALAAPATTTPICVIKSNPPMPAMGSGGTASSIADILQIGCKPVYSGQHILINATQLSNLCHGTLAWYSDLNVTSNFTVGPEFTVALDDDGNATAIVFGGPSCAATKALITASLQTPPYTTVSTYFRINPPHVTRMGIFAVPSSEVEDATLGGVATVLKVEFPSVYAGQHVTVTAPQLFSRCTGIATPSLPALAWYAAEQVNIGTNVDSATVTLDNDGNAFVVAIASGCSSGSSLITADLTVPPYTTLTTSFRILAPRPTV